MTKRLLAVLVLAACGGNTVPTVIVDGASLQACPDKPNCVSSQADPSDEGHYIAPLAGTATVAELSEWMGNRDTCEVVETGGNWVHASCTTPLMGFVDDVALLIDDEAAVIHVRSASRVGHSDMGKNRSRVEELSQEWAAR